MDPRILQYYNQELQYVREMGAEFAQEFPKVAGRLGLDGFECADPYVERLLEGFAFLAARVQLKIDAEFPRFTQHLLEIVYPHYLAPIPSTAMVQFRPDLSDGSLAEGFQLPRDTVLRSLLGPDDQTPCEYRTAHDVTLWPLEVVEADYFTRESTTIELPNVPQVKAGVRLRLRTTAGLTFDKLSLDSLPIYLPGTGKRRMRLYEQILAGATAMVVRPVGPKPAWQHIIDKRHVQRCGFDDNEALLPPGPRSFSGYRLLQEYFMLPDRYLFVELSGLNPSLRRLTDNEVDIFILLDRADASLENAVTGSDVALFCSPAINLFSHRADRIHLTDKNAEHHVVPDRTRPLDFEIYDVSRVLGFGADANEEQEFTPFYASGDAPGEYESKAYYTVHRRPRVVSSRQQEYGPRSSYMGSEVFLSLVDAHEAPHRHDLRQLSVQARCTNRDLPLLMPLGTSTTDFTMETSAPVDSVRCVAGPTRPKPSRSFAQGETSWRLISHLSLNYLSLSDTDERKGAAALRELLQLYGDPAEASTQKEIEGVRSVVSRPITQRIPNRGPIAYGRGVEVSLNCDESSFEGTGVFLLGAVLEQFFARYVSINSFTETVLRTPQRGEITRWPARIGRRHTL